MQGIYLSKELFDGAPVGVIMRQETVERLASKAFRGRRRHLAGNFRTWSSAFRMMRDHRFLEPLLEEVFMIVDEDDVQLGTYALEVYLPKCGWASTVPIGQVDPQDLVAFKPNRKSAAMRINSSQYRAPLVDLFTIRYEIRFERADGRGPGKWAVVIHWVQPGRDIGRLSGNVSEREQIAFFNWGHPGE